MCTYRVYHNIFRFFCTKKNIAQKHAVLQQDLKLKKMKGKRGGGGTKKNSTPSTFLKTTYFQKNSSLDNVKKIFEVYPKKFCCLKNIICTHPCTHLWHQGIIAFFCRIWKQNLRFLQKYNAPDVPQSFFLQICWKVSYCLIYIIARDLKTQATLYSTFFVATRKNEKNQNLAGFPTGFEKKMCTNHVIFHMWDNKKNFSNL